MKKVRSIYMVYMVWYGPSKSEDVCLVYLAGGLNTRDILLQRGEIRQKEEICVMCNGKAKMVNHLFIYCLFVSKLWWLFIVCGNVNWVGCENTRCWFKYWMNQEMEKTRE
ncbi:hypothetical protein PIB30_022317 [Stylosanthes scabra]|uniref:Reverse transcriptase zinc-binding domain-containing protein n=1 Tax=Stylosanthes scabra TaxID=79078 RepID=A0ABU6U826_9FABA|nr:hypothetical protein [Stylosanthes scabra]